MLEQMTQEILTLVFVSVAGVEAPEAPEAAAVVVAHPVVAAPNPGGGCDYG